MKIITIIGARPQFIKAAVVSRAFRMFRPDITEILVHTGQHYDANMSDVFFAEMEIPAPTYNLGIGGGTHGQNTGRMIEKIEEVLLSEKPDWVLVFGDTDSTLAGAIAASKLHIRVAHVEAGLRSFNRQMPEETNRVLTDHVSSLLFTPTSIAEKNLQREGISQKTTHMVGDVMYDAALFFGAKADRESTVLSDNNLTSKNYVLATIHRQENTDDKKRLEQILNSLGSTPQIIVWPMHPRTRERIKSFELAVPENIKIIDPVGYIDMVMLEKHACLIATDSGGVQKEAFFHKVPCLTLRTETEWLELVDLGVNRLVMEPGIEDFLFTPDQTLFNCQLYGNGLAADKIVNLFT